jgi:hypothetical protein
MRYAAAIALLCVFALPGTAEAYWTTDLGLAASKARPSAAPSRGGRAYMARTGKTYRLASLPRGVAVQERPLWGGTAAPFRSGGGHVGGECWTAARMGGPCGCEASKLVYGRSVRELWLVANWRQFPRTSPHVGAAALWGGNHHVEIVIAVHGDGTVSTAGSVGFFHVAANRLTFVEPGGSVERAWAPYPTRWRHRRYASR